MSGEPTRTYPSSRQPSVAQEKSGAGHQGRSREPISTGHGSTHSLGSLGYGSVVIGVV